MWFNTRKQKLASFLKTEIDICFLISAFALSVTFLVHRILSLRVMYNYYYKRSLSCGKLHVHVYSSPGKHYASVPDGRAYPYMHYKH